MVPDTVYCFSEQFRIQSSTWKGVEKPWQSVHSIYPIFCDAIMSLFWSYQPQAGPNRVKSVGSSNIVKYLQIRQRQCMEGIAVEVQNINYALA